MGHKRFLSIDGHYLSSIIYILISFLLGIYLMNGLILFLGWNMVLATVVYILAQMIETLDKRSIHPIWKILLFGLWVLFFPNAIYILTDYIHLEAYDFFTDYPNVYAMQINDWMVMAHITIGALIAMKMGMTALMRLESRFIEKLKLKPYRIVILTILFALSSTGIYIGRFLRFNSWDIIRIFSIINQIIEHYLFALFFIIIFTIVHWVSYLLFASRTKNSV